MQLGTVLVLQPVRVRAGIGILVDIARDGILEDFDGVVEGGKIHCILIVVGVFFAIVVVLVVVAGAGVIDLDAVEVFKGLVEAAEGVGRLDVVVAVTEGASETCP